MLTPELNHRASSIKDQITECGYVFIPEHSLDKNSVAIAKELGQPLVPWEGGLVQELVPRASSTPNTYSGIYGLDRFPFHTDLAHWRVPPRYLLLRCVSGYEDVPTLLIDGKMIIEAITLDILTRAIFKPRRPRGGTIALLRLCEQMSDGHRLRWDEIFLKPASKVGEIANDGIRQHLVTSDPIMIALSRRGDMLLIDNWRMLHARSPIPAGREGRKIERIYLESLY